MTMTPFNHQGFIADVVTAVTDLFEDGQVEMEKRAAMMIPATRNVVLKEALKEVFVKAKENVEQSLQDWHAFCAATFFPVPSSLLTLEKSWITSDKKGLNNDNGLEESTLDYELDILRDQLSTAQKERSMLEMELQSLELWLKFKYCQVEALNNALHVLDEQNFHTIIEIARTADALQEKANRARNTETSSF
ncbi:hypothetical protein O6H91_13G008000 [Diphasiastrum complanatum]|uniref:Uncharacterized protein n=1 Tax=Diphasiastrum complanatum TaxID=34168 RepID=A0ACC2BS28_DIPCM|nr:hypothetical protein O6H91_13G008000 [Diphasiastrum complanatum]